MSTLLDDLADRGLLEKTLVITLGEFGRTPQINPSLGRDHFASAWSASLSGCGIKGGTVYGKTDDDGSKSSRGRSGPRRCSPRFSTPWGLIIRRTITWARADSTDESGDQADSRVLA